jgi:hypothetical protein
VDILEGTRPLGRPTQNKEDVMMDLKEMGWEGMN